MKKNCYFCNNVKYLLRKYPWPLFSRAYTYIFGRPSMQFLNDIVLRLALHGRGYNNCCSPDESGESKFIHRLTKFNPKLCIDIGANKGLYSKVILESTDSYVIAFEPLPISFTYMNDLLLKYKHRSHLINKGVGDKNAELMLSFGATSTELASFNDAVNQIDYVKLSNTKKIKVPVVTLDSFMESFKLDFDEIDLIKIDTEGYEYQVLLGATNTIRSYRPKFIQIEYNWHQLFTGQSLFQFSNLLENYQVYQILPYGEGLISRDLKTPDANIFLYSNFVFIRDDISSLYFNGL